MSGSFTLLLNTFNCVKSVRIRRYSGPHFPTFGLNSISLYSIRMRENADQNNSKYGHFLRGDLMCVVNEIPRLASEFLELMTMFLLYNINAGVLFSFSD